MPRVRIDIDVADLRRRLGLTQEQLPDTATTAQIEQAFEGSPSIPSDRHPGLPDDDMVLIEREEWDRIQRERAVAANQTRDSIIDDAIRRGKFAPHRRSHYVALWESDPNGATQTIAAMADGVVPTDMRGSVQGDGDLLPGGGDFYPPNWLPDVHHEHEPDVMTVGRFPRAARAND